MLKRNEAKSKEIELSKLASEKELLTADLRAANLQTNHLREHVLIHEKKFTKLEESAKSEYLQLQQELKLKSNELDLYQKTELQLFMNHRESNTDSNNGLNENFAFHDFSFNDENNNYSAAAAISRRYKQHIYQLTEKYKSLQINYQNIDEQLQKEQKKNEIIQSKYASIERLMQNNLSGPTNYVVKSINDLEQKVHRVNLENQALRKDMDALKLEKDSLEKECAHHSETRKQFDDLKILVKALKTKDDGDRNNDEKKQLDSARTSNGTMVNKLTPTNISSLIKHVKREPCTNIDKSFRTTRFDKWNKDLQYSHITQVQANTKRNIGIEMTHASTKRMKSERERESEDQPCQRRCAWG